MGTSCIKSEKILFESKLEKPKNLNTSFLNKIIENLNDDNLYCDNEFMANNDSILYNGSAIQNNLNIIWKRSKVCVVNKTS